MGHHKNNDDLREDRFEQEADRQELRDDFFEETGRGEAVDLGSQDERRKEGDKKHNKGEHKSATAKEDTDAKLKKEHEEEAADDADIKAGEENVAEYEEFGDEELAEDDKLEG